LRPHPVACHDQRQYAILWGGAAAGAGACAALNRDQEDRDGGQGAMSTARNFPPAALAPWAEIVPGAPFPMTEADLLAWPDDGWAYELVEGMLVRMPPSGRRATRISRRLAARLGDYVDARALGDVTGEQGGYRLAPRTDLAPDVGFVRAARLPPLDSPEADELIAGAP